MENHYYATLDRNGTEDEITIYTPEGRPMLCVAFWDEPESSSSVQLKSDALLIVNALNAFRALLAIADNAALEAAHDALSCLLESSDAGNEEIRDAVIDFTAALNAHCEKRRAAIILARGGDNE